LLIRAMPRSAISISRPKKPLDPNTAYYSSVTELDLVGNATFRQFGNKFNT